jgi:2-oxoisovalerate dehydrogenase E1 component beta subunit
MANMNMIQALNSAMDIMLGRNPAVVLMGEDIGYFGGVFRATIRRSPRAGSWPPRSG